MELCVFGMLRPVSKLNVLIYRLMERVKLYQKILKLRRSLTTLKVEQLMWNQMVREPLLVLEVVTWSSLTLRSGKRCSVKIFPKSGSRTSSTRLMELCLLFHLTTIKYTSLELKVKWLGRLFSTRVHLSSLTLIGLWTQLPSELWTVVMKFYTTMCTAVLKTLLELPLLETNPGQPTLLILVGQFKASGLQVLMVQILIM